MGFESVQSRFESVRSCFERVNLFQDEKNYSFVFFRNNIESINIGIYTFNIGHGSSNTSIYCSKISI